MAGTDEGSTTPRSLTSNKSNIRPPRPRIIIPNPQINIQTNPMYTASINIPVTPNNPEGFQFMYPTKAGEFMFKQFTGFKDFTFNTAKSGMSFGEKILFWMYNRISSLSKQWFTHFFLFLVILLYSVGGAWLFVAIEGHDEEITLGNVLKDRLNLLTKLKAISEKPDETTSDEERIGEAYRALAEYEDLLFSHWSNKQLIVANRGPKIWTFWNAVFYCGTIYTTIGHAYLAYYIAGEDRIVGDKNSAVEYKMDTGTESEKQENQNQGTEQVCEQVDDVKEVLQDENVAEEVLEVKEIFRFEGKVTPEQELSASVARRRRNISKKRSASVGRPRESTPVRELTDKLNSEEEQVSELPPKTPERKKSKCSRKSSLEDNTEVKTNSIPQQNLDQLTKLENETHEIRKSVKTPTTDDVSSLLNRAKQSVTSKEKSSTRLRKDVKKAAIKRSQSAPREKADNENNQELVESFKKAQLISAALQIEKPTIELESSTNESGSSTEKKPQRPTSIPLFSNILRRRKLEEEKVKTVESESKQEELDKFKPIVKKRITFKEFRQTWKDFKMEYSSEYNKIKSLRNRCLNDVILLLIFCGVGGLMFKFTEGTFENFYKCGVKRVKRDFIDALWRGSHHLREDDWKSLARSRLRDFEEQLHTAHEAGVTSYSGQRSWSFLNGIVYALTIVTTIGYGHMYPTTTTGRALTIVYAIIGIPLFLIILTDFGKLFTRAIKFLWAFVRRLYYTGTCKKARKTTAMQEVMKGAQMMYDIATFRRPSQFNLDEENGPVPEPPRFAPIHPFPAAAVTPLSREDIDAPNTPAPSTYAIDDEFNLPISVAIFLLVVYIFLGAVVYYVWEQWDFFASFYFVFISMSTIGFGDYVPRHPICMIVSIIYLVFGLALMSMCINVVQLKLSDTFRQASAKLGATIGLRVAEEDGSITTIPPPTIEIADVHASTKSI